MWVFFIGISTARLSAAPIEKPIVPKQNKTLVVIKGTLTKEFVIPSFDAHPVDNLEAIVKSVEGCKSWPVHREDLDMEHIIEMTKMQMWTLKPAQRAEKDSF